MGLGPGFTWAELHCSCDSRQYDALDCNCWRAKAWVGGNVPVGMKVTRERSPGFSAAALRHFTAPSSEALDVESSRACSVCCARLDVILRRASLSPEHETWLVHAHMLFQHHHFQMGMFSAARSRRPTLNTIYMPRRHASAQHHCCSMQHTQIQSFRKSNLSNLLRPSPYLGDMALFPCLPWPCLPRVADRSAPSAPSAPSASAPKARMWEDRLAALQEELWLKLLRGPQSAKRKASTPAWHLRWFLARA